MIERKRRLYSAVVLGAVLAALSSPAAPAAVISQHFGGATAQTLIVGSDQHLPPLVAPSPYIVGSAMGADIVRLRNAGGYTADISDTVTRARNYLDRWLTEKCGRDASLARVRSCKAMIISDMDDTLVSWYQYYADPAVNWTAKGAAEEVVMKACGTPPITPSVKLLNYARSRGVAVVLITGRKDVQRSYTASCAKQIGVRYRTLVMRDRAQYKTTAASFKAQARRSLERDGWKIAISLGDQVSDMSGGYADSGFLLPNPMYFIP